MKPAPEGRSPLKSGASGWWGQACSTTGAPAFPKTTATPCLLPGTRVSKKKKRRNPTSLTFTTHGESNHFPGLPPRSASPAVSRGPRGSGVSLLRSQPRGGRSAAAARGIRVSPASTFLRVSLQSPRPESAHPLGPALSSRVLTRPGLPSPRWPPLCPQAAPSVALVPWRAHPQKPALSVSGLRCCLDHAHFPTPTPAVFPTALITFQHTTEFSYLLDVLFISLQPESQRHGGRNLSLFRSRRIPSTWNGAGHLPSDEFRAHTPLP